MNSLENAPSWLVIGIGNRLRGDDAIGPCVAERLGARQFPNVRVLMVQQLTPELAVQLATVDAVIFVDAIVGAESVSVRPIDAQRITHLDSHLGNPTSLVGLVQALYGKAPACWLVTAPGEDFSFHEGMSPQGAENANAALAQVEILMRSMKHGSAPFGVSCFR